MLTLKELSSLPGVSVIGRKRASVLVSLVRSMLVMCKNHNDSSNFMKDPRVVKFGKRSCPLDDYVETYLMSQGKDSIAEVDDVTVERMLQISKLMQAFDELSESFGVEYASSVVGSLIKVSVKSLH